MPAAKSASLSPIVTSWPAPTSGARAAAASHIARENRNSGSSTGFWMWMRICAQPATALPSRTNSGSEPCMPPILFRDDRFVVLDKPAGLPVHPGPRGGPSVEDWFPSLSRRKARAVAGAPAGCRHRPAACWWRCAGRRCLRRRRNSPRDGCARPTGPWCAACPPATAGTIDAPLLRRSTQRRLAHGGRSRRQARGHRLAPAAAKRGDVGLAGTARRAPGGRIRCGCTARISAARCWATRSMAVVPAGCTCWRAPWRSTSFRRLPRSRRCRTHMRAALRTTADD